MAMILDAFAGRCLELPGQLIEEKVVMILGVKDDLQRLQEKLEMIKDVLSDAERRRIQDAATRRWLSKLRDVMYDADDIIDLCRIKGSELLQREGESSSSKRRRSSFLSRFTSCPVRQEIGKKIQDLNQRLEDIYKDRQMFTLEIEERSQLKSRRLTTSPPMSLPNRNSGNFFFTVSDYNRFRRRLTSRSSDSSISDAESIQSSQAEEQGSMVYGCLYCARFYQKTPASFNFTGSTGDCLPTQRTKGDEILSSLNLKAFTFNELRIATRNFNPLGIIGEGETGIVFEGWIDEQTFTALEPGVGMVVAVKKLEPEGFQGHNAWLTDVHYLGQLHHPNLVKLIGFSLDGDNRFLVYEFMPRGIKKNIKEFMPRGSLESHLFRRGADSLSWATRIKVAIGVAKGLAFLHDAQSEVIYGNVKSSNILIDSDFNAKLSNFSLEMAVSNDDMEHMMRFGRMRYTRGLLVDELDMRDASCTNVIRASGLGHLSAKTDVYGFGVVLLELLSGRQAYDVSKSGTERNLVDWARPYLGDKRKLFRIMDSKLEGQFPEKVAHAMANLVSVCIGNKPSCRPRMSEVLAVLEKLQGCGEIDNETAECLSKLNVHNAPPVCVHARML